MLIYKRLIPRVSAAALLLGSTESCGNDATIAERTCDTIRRCEPENFAAEYDSFADCVLEAEAGLEILRMDYGDECADATLAYISCGLSLYSDSCDELTDREFFAACGTEYFAASDACYSY